jgi:predicted transcriptional regulator
MIMILSYKYVKNYNCAPPPLSFVLKSIADDKTLTLFNAIATSDKNRQILLKNFNLTTKQYYSRIAGLMASGLIRKHRISYSLTALGKIVYESQIIINKALSYYWKLRAIESIEMSTSRDSELGQQETILLVNALIDNHQIRDILTNSAAVRSENTSDIVFTHAKNMI